MKPLLTLPLAALLTACANTDPIEVPVPGDPHILHGIWAGQAQSYDPAASPRSLPVTLTSAATFGSSTEYHISGTLTFQNTTYTLEGTGQGFDGATFRPQYTPAPTPYLVWNANLLLNGEKVGFADGTSNPRGQVRQWGRLVIGETTYGLTLYRR